MFLNLENAHADKTYAKLPRLMAEIDHEYGPSVHILADVFLLTHLAFLCDENTQQPAINTVVRDLYQYLIRAVLNHEFPRKVASVRTRMIKLTDRGVWTGEILDPETKAVTVSVLRAGSLPSQVCFDFLNKTLNPSLVRQDHVIMARMVDAAGKVTGSHLGDSKIGGPVDDAIVLFPDPMGATGGSLSELISYYKAKVPGKAKKYVAVNLIVTPEYIKRMTENHPDVVIYALRLDRGASSQEVLATKPGTSWNEESGLTANQYIIPGGGGFGEIMNNAYV
jgi:uracil phosphoribosyltransferase